MAGLAAVLAVVASGCVSLQANGPVTPVTEGDSGSSQVQIWPSPPTSGELPGAIVTGFLEAARSGSANLSIADAYLTSAAQANWKSEQNTVIVLADNSQTIPAQAGQSTSSAQESPSADQQGSGASASGFDYTEQVQGDLIGKVGSSGLYSARSGSVTYEFGLDLTKNGYRIASVPDGFGVLMERSDFESSYSRHDVYFENAQVDSALIPTQIYLPAIDTDQDVANAMSRIVVQGAADLPVAGVQDSLQGAVLKGVQLQNDGSATVTIDSHQGCVKSSTACHELSDQLAATLNSLSTKVTSVNLVDQANNNDRYPSTPDSGPTAYEQSQGVAVGKQFDAIADDGTVESLGTFGSGNTVTLSYGPAKTKFKQVAVDPAQSNRGPQLALVSQDGTKVYVPRKQDGSGQLTQVYPSSSGQSGGTVGALSWDAYGVLWFTVTQGGTTEVYRYGENSLSQVVVSGAEGRITQVEAAPDGSRVAVAYKDATGDSWIKIGEAAPEGDSGWLLQLDQRETVAADWSQITDFDWYNEDSLAILGIQPNSQVLGVYQIYADGSSVYDSLTDQPVEAGPPANAQSFVWRSGGQPIAAAVNGGKNSLYQLFVEGQGAQLLSGVSGTSPSY
jgi:hypothetical protein